MSDLTSIADRVAGEIIARLATARQLSPSVSLSALALIRAGVTFERPDWTEHARQWMQLHGANIPPESQGARGLARVALEIVMLREDSVAASIARLVCDHLATRAPRTEDGLLLPEETLDSVPAESLYYSAPLLAQAGSVFQEDRYVQEAARQLFVYAGHAHDPVTHLFWSEWRPVAKAAREIVEARANAFATNALVDTLQFLPVDHPRRRALHMVLNYTCAALDAHQDAQGFWHELMDEQDSPLAPGPTAFLVSALSRGLSLGLIEEWHRENVARGWQAVQAKVEKAESEFVLLAAINHNH